jgi:hypothetical protein
MVVQVCEKLSPVSPVRTETPPTAADEQPPPDAYFPAEQVAVQVMTPAPHEFVICSRPAWMSPPTVAEDVMSKPPVPVTVKLDTIVFGRAAVMPVKWDPSPKKAEAVTEEPEASIPMDGLELNPGPSM